MVIWPRIQQLLEQQENSLEKARTKGTHITWEGVSMTTRRYSDLVSGLYRIAKEIGHEMLMSRLSKLKTSLIELLKTLSHKLPSEKHKLIFMLNNMEYIYRSIKNCGVEGIVDLESMESEYKSWVQIYTYSVLLENFRSLVELVGKHSREEEGRALLREETLGGINKTHLENIAQEFHITWRKKFDELRVNVLKFLANQDNATHVLKHLVQDLMLKYSLFGEIVNLAHHQFYKKLVASQVLLELKNISIELNAQE